MPLPERLLQEASSSEDEQDMRASSGDRPSPDGEGAFAGRVAVPSKNAAAHEGGGHVVDSLRRTRAAGPVLTG